MRWAAILAPWAVFAAPFAAVADGSAAVVTAPPGAERVVFGVIDPRPELGLSPILEEAGAWLRENTVLSLVAGDQVGLDRAALAACPPNALYSCLARAITAASGGVRAGIVVARARPQDVQLLLFDVAELASVLDAEEGVYARVQRVSGPTIAAALEGLRARPGFEAPAHARVEARGCDGCVVRVAAVEAAIGGEPGFVAELRVRAGEARVEVLSGGRLLVAGVAQLDPGSLARVQVEIAPAGPAWRPFVASGLLLGGVGALSGGLVLAVSRDDALCVAHAACGAGAAVDPRVADHDAAGDAARVLAIGGVALAAAGAVLWVMEWLDDAPPRLRIDVDAR